MMNITRSVKQLLIINIIFYIGSQIVGEQAYQLFSLYFFENINFQIWQPLTHMFMHAQMPNIMHILFNMFALYSFGSALEHFWGGKKFSSSADDDSGLHPETPRPNRRFGLTFI